LVKDEIVSLVNGNIQKYEIISEVQIPSGDYTTSLNATVSVTKLTSFVESKGVVVEFKGTLFGANLKQQKLNEESELKAILNLCEISNQILGKALDFSIKLSDPMKLKDLEDKYEIPLEIRASTNENFKIFITYFIKNIEGISMKNEEKLSYQNLGKDVFCLFIDGIEKQFYFRNKLTALALQNFFMKTNKFLYDFDIVSVIDNNKLNVYFPDTYWFNKYGKIRPWNRNENTFPHFDFDEAPYTPISLQNWKSLCRNSGQYYRIYLELKCQNDYFLEKDNYYSKTESDYIKHAGYTGNLHYDTRVLDYNMPHNQNMKDNGPNRPHTLNDNGLFYCIGIFYTEDVMSFTFNHKLEYSEEQISKLTSVEIKKFNN
jgi:hypothetical protein